jgi:hypothetical protein
MEEQATMRIKNRFYPQTAAIALAAFMFFGGRAFADTTSVVIDGSGNLNSSRTTATLTVSGVCTVGDTATLTVHLFQSVGRLINIGIGDVSAFTCTGNADSFTVDVDAIPGLTFQPGPATVIVRSVTTTTTTTTVTNPDGTTTTNTVTTPTGDHEFGGMVNLHPAAGKSHSGKN